MRSTSSGEDTSRRAVWGLFAIVVLTTALGAMSQTVTNSMMSGIHVSFGVDATVGQWLTTAYMLVMGITVPMITFLSSRLSPKRITYAAMALFLVGCALSWLAPDFAVMLAGRVLQAVATGIMLPLLQAIAMTRFPAGENATAMGIAGIAMGAAPNAGPIVGGALADTLGWRSFFLIMIACLALLAIALAMLVPKQEAPAHPESLDVPSLILSTLGFGGLLMGFSSASSMGLENPFVWGSALVGASALVLFTRRQRRIDYPLISMDIFKSSRFAVSFFAQNVLFASFMGITLIAPLFVEDFQGGTAAQAGLVFVPAAILAMIVNPVAGFLVDRIGMRKVSVAASALLVVGALGMTFMDKATPLAYIIVFQAVRVIGVSALVGPLASWGLSKLPAAIVMDGSAFCATVRQVCASVGTAAMVLLVTAATRALGDAALAYQLSFGLSAALSAIMLATALWKIREP